MFIQAFNYVFGKLFNSSAAYISYSLNFLQRKRRIDRNYMDYIRLSTLELVAEEMNSQKLIGAVAELGVYKGKFARYINKYFPERKLYLFDTFKGFDVKDVETEVKKTFSKGDQDFGNTSVQSVLGIMPYPDQCIIKEGYFPDTAIGLEDVFVVKIDSAGKFNWAKRMGGSQR